MLTEPVANVAVVLATAATLAFVIPQIVKLVRTGDTVGVSTTWPAIGLTANLGWFAYFVHEALWWSLVAPFGAVVGYVVTLVVLGRAGRPLAPSLLRGSTFVAAMAATLGFGGWTALGVLLGLSFALMVSPALWEAFRVPDPSGISPGTWWLGIAEAVLWGAYGWHHADAGILTFSVTAVVGSVAMLARYAATRPVASG